MVHSAIGFLVTDLVAMHWLGFAALVDPQYVLALNDAGKALNLT